MRRALLASRVRLEQVLMVTHCIRIASLLSAACYEVEYGTAQFNSMIKALEDEFWSEQVENLGKYAEEAVRMTERLRPGLSNKDDLQAAVKMFTVFRKVEGDALHFRQRYHQTNQNHKLFASENGTVGMGPKQLQQPEDLVVIFAGYRAPCIVRPFDSRYRLIGDCYFEGVMYGEKIKQLRQEGELLQAWVVFSLF